MPSHFGLGVGVFYRHGLMIDIVVDNCAICRNHIMDLCESSPKEGEERKEADE
jgi:hypothetical protein